MQTSVVSVLIALLTGAVVVENLNPKDVESILNQAAQARDAVSLHSMDIALQYAIARDGYDYTGKSADQVIAELRAGGYLSMKGTLPAGCYLLNGEFMQNPAVPTPLSWHPSQGNALQWISQDFNIYGRFRTCTLGPRMTC